MRKFLRHFRAKEERSTSIRISDPALPEFFGMKNVGGYVNIDRASGHAVAYRCIQAIAEPIASVPLKIYRHTNNNGREAAVDHPLYFALHDMMNPQLTAFEGREWLSASCLTHGNAYARLEHDGAGQVRAMYPLIPSSVWIEKLSSGRRRYNHARPDGRSEILLQEEVLHIRYRTKDGEMGISPIQHGREAFGLALGQLDQVTAQTENIFRPPGAVIIPGAMKPEGYQSIFRSFRERYIGAMNAGVPMLLDSDAKWQNLSFPNKDAEFLESRKLSNLDICRIYGVPPSVAGITDNATYSNIGEESRALVVRCLAPWVKRIEQAMMAALLTPESRKTLFIEHDLAGLLRGDLGSRYTAYKTGREGGWLSVNEIRGFENMPEIDGGDEYLSPLNMTLAGARQEAPTNG